MSDTYRAWKAGGRWVLKLPDGGRRTFDTKGDLMDYLRSREKRLTAPTELRKTFLVWEFYR